jgi:hypothetical protein
MHRDCQAMAGGSRAMCLNCCDLCKQEKWATQKDYAKIAQLEVTYATHRMIESAACNQDCQPLNIMRFRPVCFAEYRAKSAFFVKRLKSGASFP